HRTRARKRCAMGILFGEACVTRTCSAAGGTGGSSGTGGQGEVCGDVQGVCTLGGIVYCAPCGDPGRICRAGGTCVGGGCCVAARCQPEGSACGSAGTCCAGLCSS